MTRTRLAVSMLAGLAGCHDVFSIDGVPHVPPDMVCGPDFCIDRTEVTRTRYAEFLESLADTPAIVREECGDYTDFTPAMAWPPAPADTLPVIHVGWCDAAAFCAWQGKRLCGHRDGGPISPTDNMDVAKDQWTYACTGGDPARTFPYGPDYVADTCNDSHLSGPLRGVEDNPACDGGLPGLLNMSGNVWEWHDSCPSSAADARCYMRGGAYNDEGALTCFTAVNSQIRNAKGSNLIGIRCCSDL